ncbi:hypothetical protein DERP_002725 [Dermatophagoides pteronyssinus]|uniref:Uncharacterized protein n=1 Tax=Dermatophagoides pteronyssinus TaxID=6956 RepID=A0ABQ8JWF2_DERPT|nr:hypothetical protein DERP_002725 [Dermatophagoides pteronyssinus]
MVVNGGGGGQSSFVIIGHVPSKTPSIAIVILVAIFDCVAGSIIDEDVVGCCVGTGQPPTTATDCCVTIAFNCLFKSCKLISGLHPLNNNVSNNSSCLIIFDDILPPPPLQDGTIIDEFKAKLFEVIIVVVAVGGGVVIVCSTEGIII